MEKHRAPHPYKGALLTFVVSFRHESLNDVEPRDGLATIALIEPAEYTAGHTRGTRRYPITASAVNPGGTTAK